MASAVSIKLKSWTPWCLGVLLAFSALADAEVGRGEIEPLWPVGRIPHYQPQQYVATREAALAKDFDPKGKEMPYVEWLAPKPGVPMTRACVLLISGGGYHSIWDDRWIRQYAEEFRNLGVRCVILMYRTPRPEGLPIYQSAWDDAQRAVRLVRSEAAKRGFDPENIGAFGFSAGGHATMLLASSSQTRAYEPVDALDETPCHVNWAIPIYAGHVLSDGLSGANSRGGDAPDVQMTEAFKFDAKTCPMALFHGGADVISPFGSTRIYRRLRQMKVPAELHLYPDRGHGFMVDAAPGTGAATWFGRVAEFLRQLGFLGPVGDEVSLMSRFANNDDRASVVRQDIWPKGAMPDVQTNQCTPYLEWHLPKKLTTKAIQIIYSGGCYSFNGPDGDEVAPARRYLNAKGMTVVTMKYRTPRPAAPLAKHTSAWQDLQRAIRLVRAGAAARGLDPDRIGIMGSSAGGHLTLMGATSARSLAYWPKDAVDKLPCNVQWAVAIYPAYALTDGAETGNTTGGNDDSARPVPEFAFDLDTCPILFVHGDADGWAAMNSVKVWEQLHRMGIQGEVHTLATRKHCFQFKAAPGTGSYTYLDRIWEFLNAKGFNR